VTKSPNELPLKGRGAIGNRGGRFQKQAEEWFDDGWNSLQFETLSPPKTLVFPDLSRTIVNKNQSPDIPFEQSINPYKGCEHGCIYCYARQTHSYLDLSPGLDFETKIFKKSQASELLDSFLRKKGYRCQPLCIGANTDPYQPIEKEHRVTRGLLEVLARFRHPVSIITKSALVLRDLDIFQDLAKDRLVKIFVSVTTLNATLAHQLEPRAAAPHRRLDVLAKLHEKGIPTGVMAAPMIPALNDFELEKIIEAAAKAGVETAGYIFIRLPHEVKDLFRDWLQTHYPDRAAHVMSLIQQSRNGSDYVAEFGERMRGTGAYAQLLRKRFEVCLRRYGIAKDSPALNTQLFSVPSRPGDQLNLFS